MSDFKELMNAVPWQFKLLWVGVMLGGVTLSGAVIYILIKVAQKL